jgi:hypothetical protein
MLDNDGAGQVGQQTEGIASATSHFFSPLRDIADFNFRTPHPKRFGNEQASRL